MATKIADYTPRQMYEYGKRESMKNHTDERKDWLDYWDVALGTHPLYQTAFLDGWTDAATGEDEYRHEYYPDQKEA